MPLDKVISSILITIILIVLWRIRKHNKEKRQNRNTLIKLRKKRSTPIKKEVNFPDLEAHISRDKKAISVEAVEVSDEFLTLDLVNVLSDDQQELMMCDLQSFRKPHPKLLSLTKSIVTPKELFDIIRADPELVAKVINIVNSPLFGLKKTITTINHAVVFLGVNQVKNIAMQFVLEKSTDFQSDIHKKAYQRIWSVSFLASSIGLLLAKEMKLDNAAELSTRCLLSYLGDIAILSVKPETAHVYLQNISTFSRVHAIQDSIGINAAAMGKLLADNWDLPEEITTSIELSLNSMNDTLNYDKLSAQQLADTVFCYYVCRIADMIIYEQSAGVIDIQELTFQSVGKLEFYHAKKHLDLSNMTALNSAICDPQFRRKAADTINQLTH